MYLTFVLNVVELRLLMLVPFRHYCKPILPIVWTPKEPVYFQKSREIASV